MPRFNVYNEETQEWRCFSTIVDDWVTDWMDEVRYERWRRHEYGAANWCPVQEANQMSLEEAEERISDRCGDSDVFNLADGKKAFVKWVSIKQSDITTKAFKMNYLTYDYLKAEVCDCITMEVTNDDFIRYLTSVPIIIDKDIDDYIVETEGE